MILLGNDYKIKILCLMHETKPCNNAVFWFSFKSKYFECIRVIILSPALSLILTCQVAFDLIGEFLLSRNVCCHVRPSFTCYRPRKHPNDLLRQCLLYWFLYKGPTMTVWIIVMQIENLKIYAFLYALIYMYIWAIKKLKEHFTFHMFVIKY